MPLDPSKKQPSAVPKPEQNLSAGGFFEQFVLLLLLLLKLKAWRLLVIVVPIALMMSNLYVLPIAAVSLKGDVSSSLDEINANKTVILYTASDFAASKSKVLVDRSAFPAEAAAATSFMTAAGGNADWIEDCGPETDCRERFNIHRTNPAIVALIRYSKTPEKSRTVLECLGKIFMPTSTLFRDIRCAFLYKVLILSTQKRLGLDRFADVQQFEVFYKDPSLKPTRKPTERNNIKKRNIAASISLPQSICAKYIKKNSFIRLIHATVRFTVSLAAGGVTFYMLISTITCVRALKTGGFLQRLFRSGLSVSVYWLVIWLITLVECLLFAGVFTASNALQCPGVFPASAMARLFVFLTLFCLNFAAVLLLLELLMPSTIGLSILATVISIGLLVTEFIKPPPQEKYKFLLYIFSPLFATEYITKLLSSEVRRQFSEIKQEDDNSGRLSQIQNWTAIGLLLLFLLLTYLDFILSSGNGLCLPPQYPFMPAFWSQRGKKDENDTAQGAGQVTAEKAEPHIEPVMGLSPIIVVNDITKTYRSLCFCCSDVPAVLKKLSCKIYRGQITALIGHNGAGKSTLVKILTGDELPDEGTAYIGGCLVTNPLLRLSLRGRISICPQFDDLCDALTVMDCIRVTMLSRLASKSELEKARSMLQRLGLEDKENVRSCDLSGGQKRKVSTILALLGDPDVVFLDEPTSGLDPVSRRQLWQLLQEEKSCRSIILCTQFMDEADILADRKIFLCGGKIVCAGSSMFLKQAFGCSFTLNVSLKSKTGVQPLLTKLKQIRVKSHIDTELQLEVPAMDSAVLTEAVQILETSGEVETFGLSQASLDDVFMRLGGMDSEDIIKAFRAGTLLLPQRTEILSVPVETPEVKEASDQLMTSSTKMRTFVTGQFAALFKINIKRQVRVKANLASRFLVPAALLTLMAVSTATSKTGFKKVEESKLELMQMDILVKPMLFRVEDFGIQAIPIVCISDGAANYISVDDCKRLALRDATRKDEPLPPIVIEKPPFLGIEELMSDKFFHDHVYYMLWNYRYIDDNKKWYTPCVLYYASSWQKNVSNKGRSVSIGVFFGKDISKSKVHIHRRALVAMLNFFGMAEHENTTALAVINSRETRLARTGWPLIVFLLVIPLLPISYLSDPVEDICSRVRGYLLSTGMTHLAYWINTFLMHWVQYAIFYALAIGLLMVTEAYRRAYLILAALLPLFFFGLVSNLLTMYAIAVLIKTHNTLVSTVCVLVGVLLPAAFTLLTYFPAYIFNVLIWTVPPAAPTGLVFHCMLYYFFKAEYYQTVDGSELPGMAESLWKQQEILNCLIAMPVHIIILSGIIFFVEKKEVVKEILCHGGSQTMPNKPESDMEEGARKETERVLAAPRNSKNVLEVRKLQKIHANGVHAVRGITFGTMAGEIFGLLGANGAGKSTSMSVIVGEEAATEGVCEVRVHDGAWISGREGATVGTIGYCPQHNPLFNSITVAEHIRFYAAIRGLDTIEAERQTICLMQSLGLAQHCDKQAGQLSGGNKRRLCLAIAMLGNPALIVIDEASTGVDPENKRFIWGAIRRMVHQQRSVIVTTHSMEEVEALCSRVGIMNKGRMISVGTVQQLQSRHGDAYTLELLLAPDGESAVRQKRLSIKNAVVEQFKGAHTQEDLGLGFVMRFSVPKPAVRSLSPALKWLAANQSRMGVSYWALYQMSLDQVFVNLIKMYDHSARKLAVKSGTST